MVTMASQITSLMVVYSNVCSGANQRKYQSSASLAIVWGIHRWTVNSPHKRPVTRKIFPFDDVIMETEINRYCLDVPILTSWQGAKRILCYMIHSKVHGANMGPTWGRQDPGGPHVGHTNLAILGGLLCTELPIAKNYHSHFDKMEYLNTWKMKIEKDITSFQTWHMSICQEDILEVSTGLVLGLHPADERRCYFVTTALIGWVHAQNQPWSILSVITTGS